MTSALRIAVLAGSSRPNRRSRTVADWVCAAQQTAGLELTLVDLYEVGLLPLAEPSPAVFGDYTLQHTRDWSQLIDSFDGYVLVSPEYNHSTSATLKNVLDHLYREWHDKAVGFVGYGVDGGVRAVEHLRGITAELGLAGVGPQVALNLLDDFDDDGGCAPRPRQNEALTRMLAALTRWAGALRPLREGAAAGGGDTASGSGRPSLQQPGYVVEAGEAGEAVGQLLERLQTGLDHGDADYYDGMFAADLLWGSPYRQVLSGYGSLNVVHRSLMDTPMISRSRYEQVQTLALAPGVIDTHVRRQSLPDVPDTDARGFSEMAMYVLIQRGGHWWLAAGQNTPVIEKPSGRSTTTRRPSRPAD